MTISSSSEGPSSDDGATLWERAERRAQRAQAARGSQGARPLAPTTVSRPARPATAEEIAARDAATLVAHRELVRAQGAAHSAAGARNMLYGGVIAGIGIVITAASYSMAELGGGRYVVAWGAVLVGVIRFCRGLIAYAMRWDPDA